MSFLFSAGLNWEKNVISPFCSLVRHLALRRQKKKKPKTSLRSNSPALVKNDANCSRPSLAKRELKKNLISVSMKIDERSRYLYMSWFMCSDFCNPSRVLSISSYGCTREVCRAQKVRTSSSRRSREQL